MNKRIRLLDPMAHGLCGLAFGSVCALGWHYIVVRFAQANDEGMFMFHDMTARTAVGYGFIAPIAGLILGAILGQRHPIPSLRKRSTLVFAAILSILTLTQFVLAGVPVQIFAHDDLMENPVSSNTGKLLRK